MIYYGVAVLVIFFVLPTATAIIGAIRQSRRGFRIWAGSRGWR